MEIEVINGVEWRRMRYSNGQLRHESPRVNGKRHGLCRGWYSNGQLWYVQLWNNGRLIFEIDIPPQKPGIWKLK